LRAKPPWMAPSRSACELRCLIIPCAQPLLLRRRSLHVVHAECDVWTLISSYRSLFVAEETPEEGGGGRREVALTFTTRSRPSTAVFACTASILSK
jgi:hypothetical protein